MLHSRKLLNFASLQVSRHWKTTNNWFEKNTIRTTFLDLRQWNTKNTTILLIIYYVFQDSKKKGSRNNGKPREASPTFPEIVAQSFICIRSWTWHFFLKRGVVATLCDCSCSACSCQRVKLRRLALTTLVTKKMTRIPVCSSTISRLLPCSLFLLSL